MNTKHILFAAAAALSITANAREECFMHYQPWLQPPEPFYHALRI